MRDYSKAAPTFWTGDTGRKIRSAGRDAQVVAFYLFSCPNSNWIGLYYLPLPTLCHEVGISETAALETIAILSDLDYAYYDPELEIAWVPGSAKFQIGESLKPGDKRIKGIVKDLQQFSKSSFYRDFYNRYSVVYHLPEPDFLPKKGLGSPLQGPPKPVTETETVTEAVTETETLSETDSHAATAAAVDPLPSVESFQLSEQLRTAIAKRDPHSKAAKLPDTTHWARDIDKLLRIDGRRAEDVEAVIAWCQRDGCFWNPIIQNGRKLRENFDQLWAKMQLERGKNNAANSGISQNQRVICAGPQFDPAQLDEWARK